MHLRAAFESALLLLQQQQCLHCLVVLWSCLLLRRRFVQTPSAWTLLSPSRCSSTLLTACILFVWFYRHALYRFQNQKLHKCFSLSSLRMIAIEGALFVDIYMYWERACGRRGELPGRSYGALQNWILILLTPQLHYCMTWLPTACSKCSIIYAISVQVLTESSFSYRNPFKILDLVDDTCGKSCDAILYRLPILQKVSAFVLMLSSSQTQRP